MAKSSKKAPPIFLNEYGKIRTGFSAKQLSAQTSTTIFYELKTLESVSIPFKKFCRFFKVDKRYPAAAFQRFIMLNKRAFAFLDIKTSFADDGETLVLTSSQYVGCIPIKSPVDGNVVFNLSVAGRFGEDIAELLSTIGDVILPEFDKELQIISNESVKPPLFFECANFIDKYIEAKQQNWQRFSASNEIQSIPTAGTNWEKYALRSFNPKERLHFPNRINRVSSEHLEWKKLLYVLHLSITELESVRTPQRAKFAYAEKITRLRNSFSLQEVEKIDFLRIHASDPQVIKDLKSIGNLILSEKSNSQCAWRLDVSVFFERYIQFIIHTVACRKGAKNIANPKYGIISEGRIPWMLRYLEPDLIVQRESIQYVIDAKYKSHLYNIGNNSEELKEVFRHDLHQLLAYCAFNTMGYKRGILTYPAQELFSREIILKSSCNCMTNRVTLVGIPLKKSELNRTIEFVKEILVFEDVP